MGGLGGQRQDVWFPWEQGTGRKAGAQCFLPVELVRTPQVRTLSTTQGRPLGGWRPPPGLAPGSVPLAFLCRGLSSPGIPSSRLYLSLVLGNVNVTLLSKQAK